jgi:ATP-dependent DNA ligase
METGRPEYRDIKLGTVPSGFDIIELKYDGMWGRMEIDRSEVQIYSRQGNMKFADSDGAGCLVPTMTLLGEYLHASNWADQRGLKDHYFAFDILQYDGRDLRDLPLVQRKAILKKALWDFKDQLPPWLHRVKYYSVDRLEEIWEENVVHQFFEGVVFKSLDGKYGDEWGRMKREFTIDYVFMGVSKSDKFERDAVKSILGGLFIDGELKQVCKVGGLSHAERYEFWDRQSEFIGRVFEAKGKGLFKSGALRHPNFVKFRDDKRPDECTLPWRKLFSEIS